MSDETDQMAEEEWISLNVLELSMECIDQFIAVDKDEVMFTLEDMCERFDFIGTKRAEIRLTVLKTKLPFHSWKLLIE